MVQASGRQHSAGDLDQVCFLHKVRWDEAQWSLTGMSWDWMLRSVMDIRSTCQSYRFSSLVMTQLLTTAGNSLYTNKDNLFRNLLCFFLCQSVKAASSPTYIHHFLQTSLSGVTFICRSAEPWKSEQTGGTDVKLLQIKISDVPSLKTFPGRHQKRPLNRELHENT